MRKITLENASLVLTVGGQEYNFDHVTNITIGDPRENMKAISPQGGRGGLKYRTGLTAPVTADFITRNIPVEYYPMLRAAFEDQDDVDVLLIDTATEEAYRFNDALLRQNIAQGTITEGEGSFDTPLNFACAPVDYEYVPANA